jgi:glycerophosphoryl diester phosphodiesterase
MDADDHVSRAAAVALTTAQPRTSPAAFAEAIRSEHADARANAAWALGELGAPASTLLPLLQDEDASVLQETLVALAHMPGEVSADALLPLFANRATAVRGAAALALARHQPDVALKIVPTQLHREMQAAARLYEDYVRRGRPQLTQAEIDEITGYYRCQVKMVQAISMLKGTGAMQALEEQAFRPGEDFSIANSTMAAFQLWDRIGVDPQPAVQALGAADIQVADRAEWMLVQGGPAVLPAVRKALGSENAAVRERAIRIVAWQGDTSSLDRLQDMRKTDAAMAEWAIKKIESLHPIL